MNIIETQNLTKFYGKAKGIENVSLEVKEGEIFGFIGPNGAGKSTTIRTMMGLIFPTSGSAKIFGMDCTAEIMELDLKKRIEDLSYGNKKKVGIVQGLLHSPKLIVLDEPTSGLDPLMQKKFFDIIEGENKNGATVFFSSHILAEVQTLCNRVAIIKDGFIIKIDDIKTLREDNYKKVTLRGMSGDHAHLLIEGVTNVLGGNDDLKFFYKGDINRMTKLIGSENLKDVLIEEPTLEEIFMHYYK